MSNQSPRAHLGNVPYGAASAERLWEPLGLVGIGLCLVGLVLLVVSFLAANWLHFSDVGTDGGPVSASFGDLRRSVNNSNGVPWIDSAYFGWLAWVLLVLAVAGAVLAHSPRGRTLPTRTVALILAASGVFLTLIALLNAAPGVAFSDLRQNFGSGVWLAIAGFFLLGVGSLVGPNGRRRA